MSSDDKDEVCASETGILYVAIGWKMRVPLERSIRSVRQHLDLPITVITDLDGIENVNHIRKVEWKGQPGYAVKPAFIPQLPYERTLVLDTDTVIQRPDAVEPLELITEQYGYHAAAVQSLNSRTDEVKVLCCTPSCNSGVLFLRRSSLVMKAMNLWRQYYPGQGSEEAFLTRALLRASVPTFWLPRDWNDRGQNVKSKKEVRIWHPKPVKNL
ncbi:hypothetical protein [Rhodopirellula europaea]|uniref:hypothetical protein n=1 Tax=Rhodopirellula europaea TaxID=1263866 RepID=UPI003D2D948D